MKISCHGCKQKLDVSDLEPFVRIRCPVCNTKLIVPKVFGDLILEEELGEGLLGKVYRAMDVTLDREIAVKVLSPQLSADEEVPRAFMNEARAVSAINHPNVVPIYSCGEAEGRPYIIMQFMEGGTLRQVLQHAAEPLPIGTLCTWMRAAVAGLEAAQRQKVGHHDVIPGNLFLDGEGNPKIGDFGLSLALYGHLRLLDEDGSPKEGLVSAERAIYLSPERIETGTEDQRGDIYSLGATFYHLLTGRAPFLGVNSASILASRFRGSPLAPAQLRAEIPAALDALIMRMLSRDPAGRPADYAVLRQELRDAAPNAPEVATGSQTIFKRTSVHDSVVLRSPPAARQAADSPPPQPQDTTIKVRRRGLLDWLRPPSSRSDAQD